MFKQILKFLTPQCTFISNYAGVLYLKGQNRRISFELFIVNSKCLTMKNSPEILLNFHYRRYPDRMPFCFD
jgi:hypothetical protein